MTPLEDNLIPEAVRCIEQASFYGIGPKTPKTEDDEREYYEYHSGLKSLNNYCAYGFDRKEISNFLKSVDIDSEAYNFSAECFKYTPEYPYTAPRPPDPNTDLTVQLTQCLDNNARLKKEYDSYQNLKIQLDDSRKKTEHIISELKDAHEKLAKITAERDNLKKQILSRDGNNKCLELLGTLAIFGYKIDIHATRMKGIETIVNQMELLGLSATHKTLSSWLKMAAAKIDKPINNKSPKKEYMEVEGAAADERCTTTPA